MLDPLIAFCTSTGGLIWLLIASDLSIALAYFAIPVVMAVVLRERREDIPYPWLWTLFVTFIVAAGSPTPCTLPRRIWGSSIRGCRRSSKS
jgi:hypothetical protein